MSNTRKEWTYYDEKAHDWVKPYVNREELAVLHSEGRIDDHTQVVNIRTARPDRPGMGVQGVMYSQLAKIEVHFDPEPDTFLEQRAGKPTTVLSGPNNGGKTFFLKHLYSFVGHSAYLVGANRFSQVDILNSRELQDYEHVNRYRNFISSFELARANNEDNDLKLDQVLTSLKDRQRDKVFGLAARLLGNSFGMVRTDAENMFSPFFVSMDGENLRYGSSGTRLLLTLLGTLADERFSTILMDEPEIGLSPRIQGNLVRFLYDEAECAGLFPHLQQLYVATHSHIFLDRRTYSNNFVVMKSLKQISVRPVTSISDLHQLQFNMLGNELETLFLPTAIVIVEGESDAIYVRKLLDLHMPASRVAVVCAHGEGEVRSKLHFFKEAFGDLASSLYRARLFILLDKKISTAIGKIATDGVSPENVVVLSKNGIEYYYPTSVLASIFHCDESSAVTIKLGADPVEHNGYRHSKIELATLVAAALRKTDVVDAEVWSLLARVSEICGSGLAV